MSWKGKETKTWFCHKCSQYNPYGFPDCVFCVHQGNKGKTAKGKGKVMLKDTSKISKGKGFTPSTSPLRGIYQQYQESTCPQKEKLRRLKKALRNLQGMDGMEEKIESLKTDIREQQTHVNTEQGVDKIEQTAKLLTELKEKKTSGKKYREASTFHHTEAVKNTRSHQKTEDDIGRLYEELATLGWVPSDAETEEEQDPEMNSLDHWKDPKLMRTGGTETTSQARARHARSRAEQNTLRRTHCLRTETYKAWRAWKQKKDREGRPALALAVGAEGNQKKDREDRPVLALAVEAEGLFL
jgi:hypothetical protein